MCNLSTLVVWWLKQPSECLVARRPNLMQGVHVTACVSILVPVCAQFAKLAVWDAHKRIFKMST